MTEATTSDPVATVIELARLTEAHGLTELLFNAAGLRVRIRRGSPVVAPVAPVATAEATTAPPPAERLRPVRLPDGCPGGIVHLLPIGGGPQLVRSGQAVTAEHVVAHVEYTDAVGNRMIDEIQASIACVVRRVCVEHLHQVDPGATLLEVEALDSTSPSANGHAPPAVHA